MHGWGIGSQKPHSPLSASQNPRATPRETATRGRGGVSTAAFTPAFCRLSRISVRRGMHHPDSVAELFSRDERGGRGGMLYSIAGL